MFKTIIADESTRISNPNSKTSKNLCKLKTKKKVALTGTPVSNSPLDIYATINWLSPGYFGFITQFKEKYCIMDPNSRFERVLAYKNLNELASRISRFMLRRTKEEVLNDFPLKTVNNITFELSESERNSYDGVKEQIIEEVEKLTINPKSLNLIPVMMLRLKQAVNDFRLLGNQYVGSTKLTILKDIIQEIVENGDKVLVFTQFAEMAKILHDEINNSTIIHGDIDSQDRQARVNEFNIQGGPDVMIMTEAGAYGLNLQAANYVIMYDMPWSVAKLRQREDRAHRIGQKKPVTVYNLIAKGTIDEYVQKVLHRKQKASVDILDDKDRLEAAGISKEDVKNILGI